jgi:short-subunit dehydrogenase
MVFNNAGVWLVQEAVESSDSDEAWLFEINLQGVLNGVKAFLPTLLEQRGGAVVNTSSSFALMGVPKQTTYCASKYAVRGYTEALRQELRGSGVRAAAVFPGGIRTGMVANGRAFSDPANLGRDAATLTQHHEADSMTTPEKAAAIIQRGVERGRSRILVGPDAHLTDLATRISPTHAFTMLEGLHARRLRQIVQRTGG